MSMPKKAQGVTPVFLPQEIVNYAKTRLFDNTVRPDDVKIIALHNGMLPITVETMLYQVAGADFYRLEQSNGREPIYFNPNDNSLHIPQYSGFGRRERYEATIRAYIEASGRDDIQFRSLDLDNNRRKTNNAYENFAYDFVKVLFGHSDVMNDITTVIFGPLPALNGKVLAAEERPNDYLPSQILEVGSTGKRVLNLGYVFSDQIRLLVGHMLREYEGMAGNQGKRLPIDLLMFGRVGGLERTMARHDIVFPTGIIDDMDVRNGEWYRIHSMQNVLGNGANHFGFNYNVHSVIDETVEQLERARNLGCVCVEMEGLEALSAVDTGRRNYGQWLDIRFGFAGHISDLPLKSTFSSSKERDTLATELDSKRGEQAAVNVILDYIQRQRV